MGRGKCAKWLQGGLKVGGCVAQKKRTSSPFCKRLRTWQPEVSCQFSAWRRSMDDGWRWWGCCSDSAPWPACTRQIDKQRSLARSTAPARLAAEAELFSWFPVNHKTKPWLLEWRKFSENWRPNFRRLWQFISLLKQHLKHCIWMFWSQVKFLTQARWLFAFCTNTLTEKSSQHTI